MVIAGWFSKLHPCLTNYFVFATELKNIMAKIEVDKSDEADYETTVYYAMQEYLYTAVQEYIEYTNEVLKRGLTN